MSRPDYLPFGEEVFANTDSRTTTQGYTTAGNNPIDKARQKFTGYEADAETGLNFAEARYDSSTQGRFTSADSVPGSIGNPQSLNRYAYVGNNPLNFSAPSGHDRFSASNDGFAAVMGQGSNQYPESPTDAAQDSAAYDQRLQNTRDAIAANDAQAHGDLHRRDEIMKKNSSLSYANNATPGKTEVRVSQVELLDEWGKDATSPSLGKGSADAFDYSDNPTNYILDVSQGENDPDSIFTVAITFKGLNTDGWVPDSAKATAPAGGRWSLVETPTGLASVRSRESGDNLTVLLNIRKGDIAAPSKPLSIQVSAYYTSLYRQDRTAGIERGSVTKRISLKLLIGKVDSTVREVP